jgi:hypothetical protein
VQAGTAQELVAAWAESYPYDPDVDRRRADAMRTKLGRALLSLVPEPDEWAALTTPPGDDERDEGELAGPWLGVLADDRTTLYLLAVHIRDDESNVAVHRTALNSQEARGHATVVEHATPRGNDLADRRRRWIFFLPDRFAVATKEVLGASQGPDRDEQFCRALARATGWTGVAD